MILLYLYLKECSKMMTVITHEIPPPSEGSLLSVAGIDKRTGWLIEFKFIKVEDFQKELNNPLNEAIYTLVGNTIQYVAVFDVLALRPHIISADNWNKFSRNNNNIW